MIKLTLKDGSIREIEADIRKKKEEDERIKKEQNERKKPPEKEEEKDELQEEAILIQRLLRGRKEQILMQVGKRNRFELIKELKRADEWKKAEGGEEELW